MHCLIVLRAVCAPNWEFSVRSCRKAVVEECGDNAIGEARVFSRKRPRLVWLAGTERFALPRASTDLVFGKVARTVSLSSVRLVRNLAETRCC
jgi:hypothetical protein